MSRNSQKSEFLACLNLMAFKAENAAPGSNTNSIASKPQNTSYSKQENLKGRIKKIRQICIGHRAIYFDSLCNGIAN
jgi:hypothetical protein